MSNTHAKQTDLLSSRRQTIIAWGVPGAAMIATIFLDPSVRTVVWPLSLVWMGVACLANARRCGRMHCFYTRPLLLILAVAAALHGLDAVSLGPDGWAWLGAATGGGSAGIWLVSEGFWGRYTSARRPQG